MITISPTNYSPPCRRRLWWHLLIHIIILDFRRGKEFYLMPIWWKFMGENTACCHSACVVSLKCLAVQIDSKWRHTVDFLARGIAFMLSFWTGHLNEPTRTVWWYVMPFFHMSCLSTWLQQASSLYCYWVLFLPWNSRMVMWIIKCDQSLHRHSTK